MGTLSHLGVELLKGVIKKNVIQETRISIRQELNNIQSIHGNVINNSKLGTIMLNVAQTKVSSENFANLIDSAELWQAILNSVGSDRIYFVPETSFHLNSFGSWHKDTGAQERAGHFFHWTPFYSVFTVAIYFQENSTSFGGGLDVIPSTHYSKECTYEKSTANSISLATTISDAVIFDMRTEHKATPPAQENIFQEKIAAYFTVCAPSSGGDLYLKYLKTRPDYSYLSNFIYPRSWSDLFSKYGINVL